MGRCEMCQIVGPGMKWAQHWGVRGPCIHLQSTHTIWEPAKPIFKVRCGDSVVNTNIQTVGFKQPKWLIRRDGSKQRWSCTSTGNLSSQRLARVRIPSCTFRSSPARARSTTQGHEAAQTKVTTLPWLSYPGLATSEGDIMMPREGPKLHNYIG